MVSRLYRLNGNYFDRQDELVFRTKDVYDVTGFSEWGNYYLVFAMAYSVSTNRSNVQVSRVFYQTNLLELMCNAWVASSTSLLP